MSDVKRNVIVVALCLMFCLCWGCTKRVGQQGENATLPPVENVEEKTEQKEGQQTGVEPSQMEVAEIDASIKKKSYEGIEGEFMETSLLKDCHFAYDKYDLDYTARNTLAENAEIIKKIPGYKIQVEGHCDERGSKEYNLALGERRAASVKNYLVSLGISADDISTISYGEEMPLDPQQNEEAWAKNRRGHIIILSKDK